MNDLRTQLQQGDPVARESGLSALEIERMRRVVLDAAHTPRPVLGWRFAALAATMLLAVTGGVWLTRHPSASQTPALAPATVAPARATVTGRQQLQFSTPGGTRLIWTFDPNFEVR